MRAPIPSTFDPRIVPITAVVGVSVSLQKTGSNLTGLCPLHQDKDTPSLVIYPSTNSWCCFGSGCGNKAGRNGGSVVDWVMQKEKLNFRDAANWLEAHYGNGQIVETKEPEPQPEPVPVVPSLLEYWHSLLGEHRSYFNGRGFKDDFIDWQMFGWDGKRFVIPVWEGEPRRSDCLGIRRRRSNRGNRRYDPKYIGLSGSNVATVWGRHHCCGHNLIIALGGELDAARGVQDGLPTYSPVNGVSSHHQFPPNWPDVWFPDSQYCAFFFDKKEEVEAARMAEAWCDNKGLLTGRVLRWPVQFEGKDYCEFRDEGSLARDFTDIIIAQLGGRINEDKRVRNGRLRFDAEGSGRS